MRAAHGVFRGKGATTPGGARARAASSSSVVARAAGTIFAPGSGLGFWHQFGQLHSLLSSPSSISASKYDESVHSINNNAKLKHNASFSSSAAASSAAASAAESSALGASGVRSVGVSAGALALALVRYCDVLPADRVFYEAGQACKRAGKLNQAFVLTNRFLDICDALDEVRPRGGLWAAGARVRPLEERERYVY